MSTLPTYRCQINTDDVNSISRILLEEDFHPQESSSIFRKTNLSHQVEVHLSQSSERPSIICCCSAIPVTLPQLLSCLNSSTTNQIPLILFVQSTESFDWNPLIGLITAFNLSLNIVYNEDQLSLKLNEIIQNLAKQNLVRRSIVLTTNTPTPSQTQV